MSVTTTNITTTRVGNGVLVAFDFTMVTYDENWISVTIDSVDETAFSTTLNEDQTVSPGGTVTFIAAPANGAIIIMLRDVPIVQEQILPAFSPFPAVVVEHGLDELVMMMQQLDAAPEGSNVIDSPVFLNSENSQTSPNPVSLRFLEGLGSVPWFLETVPFQPGRGNGLKTTTIFSSLNVEYDFHMAVVENRGLILVPDDPLITDVQALATVQFVLDNSGGQGTDPTYNSITIAHDTDVPANGNVVIEYTTALGPTLSYTFDDPTGAKGYSWKSIGLADEVFEFAYLNEFAVLPTPLASYDGGPINVAATVEYVLSQVGGGGTGPFIADGGTVTEPAFTFVGNTATGIWQDVSGSIHFTIDGVDILVMSAFGIAMSSALDLGNNVIQNVINPTADIHVGDRGFNDARYVSLNENQNVGGEKTFTDTNTNVQNLVSVGNVAAGALAGGTGNYPGIGAFGILTDSGIPIGGGGGGGSPFIGDPSNNPSAPPFTFVDDLTTGVYSTTPGAVSIVAAGTPVADFSVLGLGLQVPLNMGNNFILSVADPTLGGHVGDRDYNDGRYALGTTNFVAGNGLSGGGTLAATRTFTVGAGTGISVTAAAVAVDGTVVRTTGNQNVGGEKTFTAAAHFNSGIAALTSQITGADLAAVSLGGGGPVFATALGILTLVDPSARYLKDEIEPVTGSLERICALNPCTFYMIDDDTHRMRYGFIADEAGPVYPSLATRDDDGVLATFNQNELIADLVKSVQILTKRVEELGG